MGRPGAQPNPEPSAVAIVRHGLTRRERLAVATRDERTLAPLRERYDADTMNAICHLCDEFKRRHGRS